MKRVIKKIWLILFVFIGSCAPLAEFVEYDIYEYHPYVYGEDGVKDIPPLVLEEGESWVSYLGIVKRIYKPRKKFDYITTVIIVRQIRGRENYEYAFTIKGKAEIWNKTRCYLMQEKVDGEINRYLINEGKRYKIE